MYYLKSRYYDPEVCRFINADDPGTLGADGTILSHNQFAYCENNPINRIDNNGELSFLLGAALIGGLVGAGTQIASNLIFGSEHWYDGIAGAFAGGAAYNFFSLTTNNPAIAGYTAAAIETIVNEGVDYLFGKKNPTEDNLLESVGHVLVDTIWNGSFYALAGKVADEILPIPSNYGYNIFRGPVARRLAQQTLKQAEVYFFSKIVIRSLLS